SPDGSLVYYNDPATRQIAVFGFDPADGLSNRRVLVELPEGSLPDGLTVDSEGCVWTAVANGGAVHRYRADGRLDGLVEVGTAETTAGTFGGDNLVRLFVTTSQEHVDTSADPLAGALFVAEVGVDGQPSRPFGWCPRASARSEVIQSMTSHRRDQLHVGLGVDGIPRSAPLRDQ